MEDCDFETVTLREIKKWSEEAYEYFKKIGLKDTDKFYVLHGHFDYLDVPDEELDGLHAFIVDDDCVEDRVWFCATDGISYNLPFDESYYDEENEEMYVKKSEFETYFDYYDYIDEGEILEKAEIEVYSYSTFLEFVFSWRDIEFSVELWETSPDGELRSDDYLGKKMIREYPCSLIHVIRDEIMKRVVDSIENRYAMVTRNNAKEKYIIKTDDGKYALIVAWNDNTGNCFYGGFIVEKIITDDDLEYLQSIMEEE